MRQCEFVEFQTFTHTEIHKMLHPSQTRWLSLSAVVERVLEQWGALQLYFNEKWLQEKLPGAESIFMGLNDPFMKLYYLFLKWALPKFTKVNRYFQSSQVVITDVHEGMQELYKDFLSSYMKRHYIHSRPLSAINPEDDTQFLMKQQMYLGVYAMEEQNNPLIQARKDLLDYFHHKCQLFLIQACVAIRKRYDFNNPVMEGLKKLKPKYALSSVTREQTPSLIPLLRLLPRICPKENYQEVDTEWRNLPMYPFKVDISKEEIDVFWGKLLSLTNEANEYPFRNVARCALAMLSFPHFNADSERTFSKINRIKTKSRNRLIVPTIRGTVLASQHVTQNGGCILFKPSKEALARMTKDSLYDKANGLKSNVPGTSQSNSS